MTRSIIQGNFRHYILIAGLVCRQLSIVSLSPFLSRHSSVVVHLSTFISLSSVTYCLFTISSDRQFFKSSLFFAFLQLTLLLPCLRWPLVNDCCLLAQHWSGVAVWSLNFTAAVCDACQHPSPCSVAGTRLLVTSWCHLLPVLSSTWGATAVTPPLHGPVSCRRCVTGSTSALSQVSWLSICVLSPLTPKAKHIQDQQKICMIQFLLTTLVHLY